MAKQQESWSATQLVTGLPVVDVMGEAVGTLVAYDLAVGTLQVQQGVLASTDVVLPLSAIASIDAVGVHLSVPKDDVEGHQFMTPPVTTPTGFTTTIEMNPDLWNTTDTRRG